jgi:hypothetical protein
MKDSIIAKPDSSALDARVCGMHPMLVSSTSMTILQCHPIRRVTLAPDARVCGTHLMLASSTSMTILQCHP